MPLVVMRGVIVILLAHTCAHLFLGFKMRNTPPKQNALSATGISIKYLTAWQTYEIIYAHSASLGIWTFWSERSSCAIVKRLGIRKLWSKCPLCAIMKNPSEAYLSFGWRHWPFWWLYFLMGGKTVYYWPLFSWWKYYCLYHNSNLINIFPKASRKTVFCTCIMSYTILFYIISCVHMIISNKLTIIL